MSIALAGYRGSGKTTVGKILAQRLSHAFVDSDDLIIRKSGKSIREIFAEKGETGFRDLETATLREVAQLSDHVIGLGGGALVRPENRQILSEAGHTVVYLKCDPKELNRRIQGDPLTGANRPNLTQLGGGIAEIESLLSAREPIYRSAMAIELDVTSQSPEKAAEAILQWLKNRQQGI